ncbi:protocadherin-like wing polarity protein stan isoform X2 [Centruroides sculpturatus]|uniref:protocadherin-like wing polarity protein stan isoform X2 n=1 Tax=Centruroides sculpturatus TaxID=218467 RepID=UPI000C6D3EC8|nr:protocadherin-like wing polarity protein stan isoform X2 [Centruroides sculpturatus]
MVRWSIYNASVLSRVALRILFLLCWFFNVGLAYEVHLSARDNKPGVTLFNASLGNGRSYSVDPHHTPRYVSRLVHVTPQEGVVYLRHSVRCAGSHLSDLATNPFVVYVQSRSFRLSGSETEQVSLPLVVFYKHRTCHRIRNIVEHSNLTIVYVTVVDQEDGVCYKTSQFVMNLARLLPAQVKKCAVDFEKPSDSRYTIEKKGKDFVANTDFCVRSKLWQVTIPFRIKCVSDEIKQVLEINFHVPGQLYQDDYILTGRRRRREMRNIPPYFDRALYIVSVPEEKERGHVVTTLTATDINQDEITYSLHAVLDARSQSMFTIDSISGVITTTARLDREYMDVHYLRITATDSGTPSKSGSTTLQINVVDYNDHSPVFEQATYETSIRESVSVGSTVVTVRATDQDTGTNADVEYSILNPTGVNDAFRIDPKTGIITTRSALDRESTSMYSILVQASDLGPVADRKSATTTVEIIIKDDNDNYPQFTEKSYTVQVAEDINWVNNPVIASVKAYDADAGINAALRYSLIGGNTQGHFVIDSLSGDISVVSPLDYESARSYRLVVRVQDGGLPSRSNTTQVLVNILDVNDNDPKFYTSLFQESVIENVPIGHSIVRVQAYDADDGVNSQIVYVIQSKIPDMSVTINKDSGWIVTTRELDREERSNYEFSVVASDQGQPSRSATARVIIRIQDINDNDPIFDPKVYEASVSEIDPPGTPVVSVTATDRDEDPRLIYQITNGNVRGRFNIISQNRQGLISIAQPLDYKLEKRFVLTITATDSGGRTDVATVYVNVTDANTHRPVFERTPYSASVPEDSPIGTTVLVVEASDGDVGENARITYTMDNVPEFRIDPNTGSVVTAKLLDREKVPGYTIVVTAQDNGNPPMADTTNVEIEVSDVNDNSPSFHPASYTSAVSEDALVGTSVLQISANDKDLGLNGQIRYTFMGGEDGNGAFSVDPTSGIIRTNRILDRESVPIYNLMAFAIDRGSPSLSSSVSVTVYVEDINDNPPRFESDKIKLFVPENSPIGWTVGEIKAYDPDEGPNADIQYSIVGGADANSFTLVSRPGEPAELTTRIELDYESVKKKYNVIIRASSPPLRNDVDVEIWVKDVNDNGPVLNDFTILFNNYKNYFPVGPIGRVPAFDADVTDQLHYKFVSGNNANLLILNETTGEIRLSPSLNTNVPIHAVMEVSVYDGINEVLAECQLIVRLVTEAMLFNSVTVRLNDMTQTSFLSPVFDYFLEGLAAIIPCPKDNIYIFNVQDDTDVEAKILNVSFSARSFDSGSFYSPQYLQERVYLNRAILARLANVQVLPFDDNLCVREPCVNFEECLSVLKFGKASGFIASDSLLFRPIYPVNTFACRCPSGFTGMNHNYECDTEVNLCYSNPCGKNGTCVRKEGGYACLCKEGFTGKNCEVNLWEDGCRVGLCSGNSRCKISEGGIVCQNCTHHSWSTKFCELRARSFPRGSFLTFPSLRQRHRIHIKLRFATREKNAVILYNGRYNDKHDFIALEIINSQLVFSFSLGVKISKVSASIPGGISDGQWHTVEITYLNRTATISIDNCDSALAIKHGIELGNYLCANKTTQILEPRCADLMQTCYRYLDLMGPLQLGGLPILPSKFQIANKDFVGCIMDLYIDHKLLDLNSFVANNGTIAGCSEKKGFCQSHPCQNGGLCEEGWGSYVCRCPVGFGGQDCDTDLWKNLERGVEPARHFLGDGFLIFNPHFRPINMPWINSLSFRTRQEDGLLMQIQLGQNNKIELEIINGHIRYHLNDKFLILPDVRVNDGKWHHIEAKWMSNGVWLSLDYGQYEITKDIEGSIKGMYIGKVSIGGLEPSELLEKVNYFKGCIQNVKIGNNQEAWLRPTVETNVREGCRVPNPCHSNTCPAHSQCIDLWEDYKCQCDPGYVGEECLPVCQLNPCEYKSLCHVIEPGKSLHPYSHNYYCECDSLHSGQYCEIPFDQPCPSNWWGYPICGPCDCDVSKGYDANCNKSTGECTCEENHFQPPNSDICFDCDCYATGSFSNRCDPFTGQCRCRAGVIGRRCDSCSNPFAEVTLRGCEVIYDSCPQSFSNGIWWERTLFEHRAIHICPKGSRGNASRLCTSDIGWEKPDLFNCTSDTFLELSDQLSVIEINKLPLSTYLAIKISADMKNAVNATEQLYGTDILILARLLHHVLNYENHQRGLNLTHRQDRDFIQNLVFSASAIFEPRYFEVWERIATITGDGPEHLLLMFEKYGQTLVYNQGDTFTKPFEIASKNMIFGLDTISTAELWGYSILRDNNKNSTYSLHPEPSAYLEIFHEDSGPSVIIPKYNNYPVRKHYADDITRAIIPLKTIGVKSLLDTNNARHNSNHIPKEVAVISYLIYPTMGEILPKFYDVIIRQRYGINLGVSSPIITLVAQPLNQSSTLNSLLHNIRFRFRILDITSRSNPQCVHWNFGIGDRGKWSSKGCKVEAVSYGHHPYVNCSCGHLSSFSVLMDITDREFLIEESVAQDIVSYVGIIISLLMLAASFIVFCILRGLQTNSNTIHKNLVACLFFAELLFLVALKSRRNLVHKEFPCKVVAILLHYTFLCIFSWMFMEAVHLYRMLTEMRDINHGQMRFYYSIGYGAPAIIVGLAVGVRADQYGNYFFCWLSIYESVVWSLVGPICFVVLLNLGVFAMSIRASIQIKDTVTDFGNLRTMLWLGIVLLPLLGATWVLAMLSVNESLDLLHYIFSVFCMVSGIYIFVGYCIINKKVRQQLIVTWAHLTGKKVPYDESLSGTRTTMVSRSALAYHNSSFDILHRNIGISTSSTTSRSTAKTSSSPYRSDSHLRNTSTSTSGNINSSSEARGHTSRKAYLYHKSRSRDKMIDDPDTGEVNRRRTRDSDSDSDLSLDHASLDLASSHSSDEDEYDGRHWRQNKNHSKKPELPPKSNIIAESESTVGPISHSFNMLSNNSGGLGVNISPYNYASKWMMPHNISVQSQTPMSIAIDDREGSFPVIIGSNGKPINQQQREIPAPQFRNITDLTSYLESTLSPPLADESPSPEQLPVPERADSLPSNINTVNNNLNSIQNDGCNETSSQTSPKLSSVLSGHKMVIPPLTATELSSESDHEGK